MTGGLAAALLPVVEKSARFGSVRGSVRDGNQKEPFAELKLWAPVRWRCWSAGAHYGGYYEGFANSALWQALHWRRSDFALSPGRLRRSAK